MSTRLPATRAAVRARSGHWLSRFTPLCARSRSRHTTPVHNRKMAEASVTVPYTQLQEGVQKLLELPAPHYVVFLADPDPATGVSWCPDCVRCGPAVKAVMADKKASLLEVLVGQRAVWKDPQHPLRHDPEIQLRGVPDLMRWSADGPTAKMGSTLEKAASPQEAVAVVAKFYMDTQ